MKKGFIFAATVASIAMTACTNDEVMDLNVENDEITFRTVMGTRGSETSMGTLSSVYVSAFTENSSIYFNEAEYKRSNGAYNSVGGSYKWPGFSSLNFYAHYPSIVELDARNDYGYKLIDIKPKAKISEQKDFVAAVATGSKDSGDVVLNFSHEMSQIEVRAMNTNSAYTFFIRGVKFGNFISDANFDMSKIGSEENPWEMNSPRSNYSISYVTALQLDGNDTKSKSLMNGKGNAMLIPQTLIPWSEAHPQAGAYIAVLLQIRTKTCQIFPNAENKYAWAAIPLDYTIEAGKKYVFTLDFSDGAGIVGPQEDYNMDGDNEGSLQGLIDEDMANNHLYKDILGGNVIISPKVNGWDDTVEVTSTAN